MIWQINLLPAEVEKCRIFAEQSAKTQRPNRSGGTDVRSTGVIAKDTFRGKLGEAVCKKFLEQAPLAVQGIKLDFDVYPRGKWDEADININRKKIAVKSVKYFSSWLLVESKDIARGDAYDYYVLVRINKEMTGGQILGYATKKEIVDGDKNTLELKKGDLIPGTGTILDADNNARYKDHLHNSEPYWLAVAKESHV